MSETYCLEYWIASTEFSTKTKLETHLRKCLAKHLDEYDYGIEDNKPEYLVLRITSTEKLIESCRNKLKFEQEEWAFRAKDELGDALRLQAYPILAEIEVSLRTFINRGLIEVFDFVWWQKNPFYEKLLQQEVENLKNSIKNREGERQAKQNHPLELIHFDTLIEIVDYEFREWSDNHPLTVSELAELLSNCNSLEDVQNGINERRKGSSLWTEVFSRYFDDENKDTWLQLKGKFQDRIIPIRNKVMHHRLLYRYELNELENYRDETVSITSTAKMTLSEEELKEVQRRGSPIFEEIGVLGILDIVRELGKSSGTYENLGLLGLSGSFGPEEVSKNIVSGSFNPMEEVYKTIGAIVLSEHPDSMKKVSKNLGLMGLSEPLDIMEDDEE